MTELPHDVNRIITVDPASGEEIAAYHAMSVAEVDNVIAQVDAAQTKWNHMSVPERAAVMRATAATLRDRRDALANLATREMGKPIVESRSEVEKCALVCDYYAEASPRILADREVVASGSRSWIGHEPLGTILAVMPWNFPFWQVFRVLAPLLMAGNAAVLKHSPNVSGVALAIEEVLADSGLLPGVVRTILVAERDVANMVTSIIEDDRIAGVTFTGSNRAGSQVAAAAGRAAKKSVLELGGSDPFVVLEDADLDLVVEKAVAGRFLNTGQSCLCAKRFIVHSSLVDEFTRRFAEAVAELPIGDPASPSTRIGPMARADLAAALAAQLAVSVAAGATVVTGGGPLEVGSAWFAPTVLSNVTLDMPVMGEETFGPVAAVISFDGDREAVRIANATPFGLGASVWSADVGRALSVGRAINSGALFVNANTISDPRLPFGGVKQSGYGRELGEAGAVEFTNVRTFVVG